MTTHSLYRHGRVSALPTGGQGGRADYQLVEKLRAIREQGDEAMTALEQYDPEFSLKLAACREPADAEALLADWLGRRTDALKRTEAELLRLWREAQPASE